MKMKVTFENYYGIKTIRLASIKTEKPRGVLSVPCPSSRPHIIRFGLSEHVMKFDFLHVCDQQGTL